MALLLRTGQDVLATAAPQAAPVKGAAPRETEPVDGGWPRGYTTSTGARILLYQPQIASWENERAMVAYAAVGYQPPGAAKPTIGTVRIESDTSVAMDVRLVKFTRIRVAETNFPSLPREQVRDIAETLGNGIPEEERVIGLDRVLASVNKSQIRLANVNAIKADPPTIYYSTRPAILVNFDGDPIWSPVLNNDLKFAVNTNWDIFQYPPDNSYYLRNEKAWLKATDVKGPWKRVPASTLPSSFSQLPADDNWGDVRATLAPPKATDGAFKPTAQSQAAPQVFVSTTPAELIVLRGTPTYVPVASASPLLWLQNTDSDVFRMGTYGQVYYLVAGRWFTAKGFGGPWTFATPDLPAVFKKIPLEHPRSRVLASVPGTPQAAEAVLLAQVPQTARVKKRDVQAPPVEYQGDAQFEPIPTTTVSRATNTDKDVIKVGDTYYTVYDGIWFTARSATGPWSVAESVPREIYEIPASSPAHNVTYVTIVEDDHDDEWVTFAAYAGYTGMMVGWGCLMWGTGWYYPPYVWYGGFYPIYYPFYPTYGFSAWYNPWTGAYGRAAAWYGPYGGVGAGARYNPRTGTYSRGAMAWGPGGAVGFAQAYNPRTGTYARTSQGRNVYGSWGSTSVQRGDQWAQTARVTNRRTGTTTRATAGSGGGAAITRRGPDGMSGVARTGSGDIYAGRDGNAYRRQDGSWQKYENGAWNAVDKPSAAARDRSSTSAADRANTGGQRTPAGGDTVNQLNRDRAARSEGSTRTNDYSRARSSGATRSGGSYRPSGGFRGGGRRR